MSANIDVENNTLWNSLYCGMIPDQTQCHHNKISYLLAVMEKRWTTLLLLVLLALIVLLINVVFLISLESKKKKKINFVVSLVTTYSFLTKHNNTSWNLHASKQPLCYVMQCYLLVIFFGNFYIAADYLLAIIFDC